jgi:hypothetical protein
MLDKYMVKNKTGLIEEESKDESSVAEQLNSNIENNLTNDICFDIFVKKSSLNLDQNSHLYVFS